MENEKLLREIIEIFGGRWVGFQEDNKGNKEAYVMFNNRIGSTKMIKTTEITIEKIIEKLK